MRLKKEIPMPAKKQKEVKTPQFFTIGQTVLRGEETIYFNGVAENVISSVRVITLVNADNKDDQTEERDSDD